jgi:hypothetical protein
MAKMVVNSDGSPRLWFICGIKQQWEEKGQIINISYELWFNVKKFGSFCYLNYIWCDFFLFFCIWWIDEWCDFFFTSKNPKNKSLNKQREAKQHYQDTIRILIDWECVIVGFFYYYRVYCWSFNITHYNTLIYTFYLKLDYIILDRNNKAINKWSHIF